jgi:hypothetical protein
MQPSFTICDEKYIIKGYIFRGVPMVDIYPNFHDKPAAQVTIQAIAKFMIRNNNFHRKRSKHCFANS